jgi:hypothetical protein
MSWRISDGNRFGCLPQNAQEGHLQAALLASNDRAAGNGWEALALSTAQDSPLSVATISRPRSVGLHTSIRGFAMIRSRHITSTERKGDRHGQGSDAQQQGKEKTEVGQKHQKGWSNAVAVLVRQDAGGPEPEQQEVTDSILPGPSGLPRAGRASMERDKAGGLSGAILFGVIALRDGEIAIEREPVQRDDCVRAPTDSGIGPLAKYPGKIRHCRTLAPIRSKSAALMQPRQTIVVRGDIRARSREHKGKADDCHSF